jgi:dTDP-4-dehydrorhamnose reductase
MIKLDKVLITGANGMVGNYVDFGIKTDKQTLDVTDLEACMSCLSQHKPEFVLHLSALTDLNLCRDNPDLAYKVNSIGTYNIALAAQVAGAKLIYVSTNAVFEGEQARPYSPAHQPAPANIYGHSKYLGELAVLGIDKNNLIVRTSWIFGGGKERDKKFVGKILAKLEAGEPVQAVNDVYGTPTYGKDLVEKLKELIVSNVSGIVHVVNRGHASRFDIAEAMKKITNSPSEITGVPLASFGDLSNTLRNETLAPGEYAMRPWQDALKEYLETEWTNI